jgi:hypothetical protein
MAVVSSSLGKGKCCCRLKGFTKVVPPEDLGTLSTGYVTFWVIQSECSVCKAEGRLRTNYRYDFNWSLWLHRLERDEVALLNSGILSELLTEWERLV